jgi:hypothetical protein
LKNYGLDYYKFIMISEVLFDDGDGYRLTVFLSSSFRGVDSSESN